MQLNTDRMRKQLAKGVPDRVTRLFNKLEDQRAMEEWRDWFWAMMRIKHEGTSGTIDIWIDDTFATYPGETMMGMEWHARKPVTIVEYMQKQTRHKILDPDELRASLGLPSTPREYLYEMDRKIIDGD